MIWGGEFGRSPTSDGGAGGSDGRDHNPYGFTIWMAGGGVKGGKVIGVNRRARAARRRRSRAPARSARDDSGLARPRSHQADVSLPGPRFPADRRRRQDRSDGKTEEGLDDQSCRADRSFSLAPWLRGGALPNSSTKPRYGWTQGAVKQDAAAFKRFLADDLQYAHAGGQTQKKEQYIAAVTRDRRRYESFTFSDLKIVLYGKAAVLTAFCDVKMVGQESFRVRTLQVYVENGGQWQMAAHQSTRLGR